MLKKCVCGRENRRRSSRERASERVMSRGRTSLLYALPENADRRSRLAVELGAGVEGVRLRRVRGRHQGHPLFEMGPEPMLSSCLHS